MPIFAYMSKIKKQAKKQTRDMKVMTISVSVSKDHYMKKLQNYCRFLWIF